MILSNMYTFLVSLIIGYPRLVKGQVIILEGASDEGNCALLGERQTVKWNKRKNVPNK